MLIDIEDECELRYWISNFHWCLEERDFHSSFLPLERFKIKNSPWAPSITMDGYSYTMED